MFLYTCICISLLLIYNIGEVHTQDKNSKRLDDIVRNITHINEALQSFIKNYKKLQNLYKSDESFSHVNGDSNEGFSKGNHAKLEKTLQRAKAGVHKNQNSVEEEKSPASTVRNAYATQMYMSNEKDYRVESVPADIINKTKHDDTVYNFKKGKERQKTIHSYKERKHKSKKKHKSITSENESNEHFGLSKEAVRAKSKEASFQVSDKSKEKVKENFQADSFSAEGPRPHTESILLGWSKEKILRIGDIISDHISGENTPMKDIKSLLEGKISLSDAEKQEEQFEKRIQALQFHPRAQESKRIFRKENNQNFKMFPIVLPKKIFKKVTKKNIVLSLESSATDTDGEISKSISETSEKEANKKSKKSSVRQVIKTETFDSDIWKFINQNRPIKLDTQELTLGSARKSHHRDSEDIIWNIDKTHNETEFLLSHETAASHERTDHESTSLTPKREDKVKNDFIRLILKDRTKHSIKTKANGKVTKDSLSSSNSTESEIEKELAEQIPLLRMRYGKACLKYVVRNCFKATKLAAKEACANIGCKKDLSKKIKSNGKITCQEEYYGPGPDVAPVNNNNQQPTNQQPGNSEKTVSKKPFLMKQNKSAKVEVQNQFNNEYEPERARENIEKKPSIDIEPKEETNKTETRRFDEQRHDLDYVACFPDKSPIPVNRRNKNDAGEEVSSELIKPTLNPQVTPAEFKTVNILRNKYERACKKESAKRCKKAAIRAMEVSCAELTCPKKLGSAFKKWAKRYCNEENGVEKEKKKGSSISDSSASSDSDD